MTSVRSVAPAVLRRADPAEHPAVGDLLEEAFTASFPITAWYRENLHRIDEHARDFDVWLAVEEVSGAPLGAVLVARELQHGTAEDPAPGPGALSFRYLAVAPRARGRGVGRLLLDHTVALARSRGAGRIAIWSGPQMTAAHHLYEAYGFARRPDLETRVVDGGQRLRAYHLDLPAPAGAGPTDRSV